MDENTKFEISLKVVLKDKDAKVLILQIPNSHAAIGGYYDFPGHISNFSLL